MEKESEDTVRKQEEEELEEVAGAREVIIRLEGLGGKQNRVAKLPVKITDKEPLKSPEKEFVKRPEKETVKRPEKEAVKRPDNTVTLQGEETEFSKVFAQLRGQARVD